MKMEIDDDWTPTNDNIKTLARKNPMMNFVLTSAALIALGIGTASAGQCTDQIGDVMMSIEKQRTKPSSNFTVASAPDPKKLAKFDELIERARVADRASREQECMEIVKRIGASSPRKQPNALAISAAHALTP